ncbi:phenylalanine--tRNA ligase subunit beta [Blattabacterium sp. (Cryptocercus kyebangensis)]|uniref:phenylalanine--tRNA ligase subunit beta n=1 Tax=Blattabacterium sp. (Cryptocercus kyebangensis) TaxID=298656 RepID=UPI000D7CF35E|nr:phenylalanine--tRNA ligase subunit beta [Blattabacterium sp. (Cryptocercus kyebangensis)]AWU43522.1 phenylalanine--tRNA ligase subunit beta [Blattabacterium sp. (Cryptocercus kyebangensis)]
MRISYNWLKKYISVNLSSKKISNILTDIGLSVKSVRKITIGSNREDSILDIDLTPNRSDAMSHYGIARDLYAILTYRGYKTVLSKPIINNYKKDINKYCFKILIEEEKKCRRYSGVALSKIKIDSSPDWLNDQLKSIGIKSINNVIDIKNFVMHELGQPIHIFDMDQIKGEKIIIKNAQNKIDFKSEDNIKRELNEKDLIISDTKNTLSIAGIISSHNSNISIKTKNIFLGSAYFNPVDIRSIGIKHIIKTDDRFLFEKGVDPTQTVYALQRMASLLKEIIKCKISSDIVDLYPNPIFPLKIKLRYKKIMDIIGKNISKEKIKKILSLLEIFILSEDEKSLLVVVPPYRIDVQREIDLIEEILRIYGINQIKKSSKIKIYSIPNFFYKTKEEIQKVIFNQLVNYGFQEIINTPMRNQNSDSFLLNSFFDRESINIINPINKYYNSMRSTLLFGIIDSIKYNYNRGNNNIKFFEFGKIYYRKNHQFLEKTCLSIAVSEIEKKSKKTIENKNDGFFYLKGIIEQVFKRIGIYYYTQTSSIHPIFKENISIRYKNKNLVELGKIKKNISKNIEIFYAEIDWEYFISIVKEKKIIFIPYSKYPTSKRDLSLLIDKKIPFEKVYQLIKKMEKDLIKKIEIYDLYEGKNLPKSKKSYTISFFFESKDETLTDIIINDLMKKIEKFLKNKLGSKIREIS